MLVAAALWIALAAAAPRDGLPPGAGEPVAGRCHMGECEWFAELERETVREAGAGRLIRVRLAAGRSSVNDGEEYSRSWGPDARVVWEAEPYDNWLFCSERLPAVIGRGRDGYVGDLLDLAGATPAPLQTARRLYAHVCEGSEDIADPGRYATPRSAGVELDRPEDIFDLP
jgi:hypothetical protein